MQLHLKHEAVLKAVFSMEYSNKMLKNFAL